MKKLLMAVAGAMALLGASATVNAAPVASMDLKSTIARDGSAAEQVHMRRWRHCHRQCRWGHHHRRCWRVCHGGWGGYGHHRRHHRHY
ncbi:MAG: hypothetical protein ABL907_12000 [Hyphomicrobium sp.]